MSFLQITLELLRGFGTTCALFLITLAAALPLGLLVAFCSMSSVKVISYITKGFVWVIRGTPLMLQVIIVFYGPGLLFDAPMKSRMLAVCIAFIINYAAYFSEIFRGGIESIPRGQYEAGQVLGMTRTQIFFKIILFQVVRRIMAPMSNEIITLVKDTSLARIIAVEEIIMVAEKLMSRYVLIWPLFYSAVFYLLFNGILTLLFGYAEKKMSYYKV